PEGGASVRHDPPRRPCVPAGTLFDAPQPHGPSPPQLVWQSCSAVITHVASQPSVQHFGSSPHTQLSTACCSHPSDPCGLQQAPEDEPGISSGLLGGGS
ncbi:MAG: hypothetical protein RIF41_39455, partial [Polyangiaceae bacterium]